MSVVVHQVSAQRILAEQCPKCSAQLGDDTAWQCSECGYDSWELATQYEDPADHVNRRTMKARGCHR